MTEEEWLLMGSNDPEAPLTYLLRGLGTERKLRLFSAARCRIRTRSRNGPGSQDVADSPTGSDRDCRLPMTAHEALGASG